MLSNFNSLIKGLPPILSSMLQFSNPTPQTQILLVTNHPQNQWKLMAKRYHSEVRVVKSVVDEWVDRTTHEVILISPWGQAEGACGRGGSGGGIGGGGGG